ncbi:MAG: hypothetical protein LBQ41_01560 [Candidatus Ancillula sp.]|jgi:hypothetical protein|nr:hypothetical protein [Candidatus Ancillula sp.]
MGNPVNETEHRFKLQLKNHLRELDDFDENISADPHLPVIKDPVDKIEHSLKFLRGKQQESYVKFVELNSKNEAANTTRQRQTKFNVDMPIQHLMQEVNHKAMNIMREMSDDIDQMHENLLNKRRKSQQEVEEYNQKFDPNYSYDSASSMARIGKLEPEEVDETPAQEEIRNDDTVVGLKAVSAEIPDEDATLVSIPRVVPMSPEQRADNILYENDDTIVLPAVRRGPQVLTPAGTLGPEEASPETAEVPFQNPFLPQQPPVHEPRLASEG